MAAGQSGLTNASGQCKGRGFLTIWGRYKSLLFLRDNWNHDLKLVHVKLAVRGMVLRELTGHPSLYPGLPVHETTAYLGPDGSYSLSHLNLSPYC